MSTRGKKESLSLLMVMIIANLTKKLKKDNNLATYLILFIIIVFGFLFLQPKVSSMLFAQKRAVMVDTFIAKVQNEKKLDPRAYWEFREFYSPGHFLFERNGLTEAVINELLKKVPLQIERKNISMPFLYFQSPLVYSLDSLTTKRSLTDFIDTNSLNSQNIIVKTDNLLVYKLDEKKLLLLFVLSGDEMKTANGFFDYREADKELVKNKNWVNISVIEKN